MELERPCLSWIPLHRQLAFDLGEGLEAAPAIRPADITSVPGLVQGGAPRAQCIESGDVYSDSSSAREMKKRLANYSTAKDGNVTPKDVEDFASEVARTAGPNSGSHYAKFHGPTKAICLWAVAQGMALDPEVIFTPDNVERFVLEAKGLEDNTKATYRSALRLVGERVTTKAPWEPRPVRFARRELAIPYTASEMAKLADWSKALNTELKRRTVQATIVLCAGAGLTASEAVAAKACHIRQLGELLIVGVSGDRARDVPVRAEYEAQLIGLCRRYPDGPLVGLSAASTDGSNRSDLISRRMSDYARPASVPQLLCSRLRSTWLLAQLNSHVPVSVIAEAAGLGTVGFVDDLFEFLVPVERQVAMTLLRGQL